MRASQGGKEGLSEEKGVEERVPPGPAGDPPNQPLEKYGEWMKVKEHRKGKKVNSKVGRSGTGQTKDNKAEKKSETSSRFAVLATEDDVIDVDMEEKGERIPLQDLSNHSNVKVEKKNGKGQGQRERRKSKGGNVSERYWQQRGQRCSKWAPGETSRTKVKK